MNLLPEPLHPLVVHFPIVLLLVGAMAAVLAAFWRRAHLPQYSAGLLVLGAIGAWVAVETGESAGGLLEGGSPAREALLDAHQMWAERTLTASLVAAVAAVAAAATVRWPRLARGLGVATALAALTTGWMVYQTGHRGGALVYQHGAGVATMAPATAAEGSAPAVPANERQHEPDKD